MTDVPKMFAELTCIIEDLHGVAIEGQAPDLSPDIQLCLIASISTGLISIFTMSAKTRKAVMELQS